MGINEELFERAKKVIPAGVNSPVRAFRGVEGTPLFFKKGFGAVLTDEENNEYIDYVGSWGPMILGHSHPEVVHAVKEAVEKAMSFGAPTRIEIEIAEKVCELMPNVEMLRMVNSGTEATLTAIRLARGYTGRNKIIKFIGCYHGHVDALLIKAGSGGLTFGQPDSAGVTQGTAQDTLLAEYNNLQSVEQLFAHYENQIAAIIVEPVAANMNCVLPKEGFLSGLRELCNKNQALLIFDEVITGFRVALGGAQEYYNVAPDITTLGKIIGGGAPVGAIASRKEIMQSLSPLGPVYQAGTLSGNPIAMTAGLATLNLLSKPGFYTILEEKTSRLLNGIQEIANRASIPLLINQVGSLFGLYFTELPEVSTFDHVMTSDVARFKTFHKLMLSQKIYLAPSAFESGFVSMAHDDDLIDRTLAACDYAFKEL